MNDIDYKKLYDDLINGARTRDNILGYTEKHHIVPRCMCGGDEDSNIVRLTVEEHLLAHMYLVEIYPNNSKLVLAVQLMIPSRISLRKIDENLVKLREYKLTHQQRKVDILGSVEREQWIEKLSNIAKNLMLDDNRKVRLSNTLKNKLDKTPLKLRSRKVKDKFNNIFESVADCARFYGYKSGVSISNKIKNRTGEFEYVDTPSSPLSVVGPDGTVYESLRSCSELTGHSRKTLRNWINNHPDKGFFFK